MAANIPEILARLNAKVGVLTERYGVVKRQRDEAISECEQLRRSLEDMTAKLEQAQIQIEYLTRLLRHRMMCAKVRLS